MLNIAICSDNKKGTQLKDFLNLYCIQKNIEFEVSVFMTCSKLCELYSENLFNIIFLDLDYNEQDIQNIEYYIKTEFFDKNTVIVFISEEEKCHARFIKLHPFDYLILPIKYSELYTCMNNYLNFYFQENILFMYHKNHTKYYINPSKILYLQSSGKKIIIHTIKEKFEFYAKLSDCMKEDCFKNFIEIHKSFWVNPQYIHKVERENVILINNIKLPISRTKALNVKIWQNKK